MSIHAILSGIPQAKLILLLALFAVLLLSTLILRVSGRRCVSDPSREICRCLLSRVKAWWGMTAMFVVVVFAGGLVSLFVWVGTSVFALREYLAMTPVRKGDRRTLFWAFWIIIPFQYYLVWAEWYGFFAVFIPVYAFILVPLRSLLADDYEHFLERTAKIQWGLMVNVYFISHAPALFSLNIPGFEGENGMLLFFLFVVVEASDVVQYLVGERVGQRAIFPQTCPHKTLEGIVAGVLSGVLIGMALCSYTPFTVWQAALMGFAISLVGQGGDLTMSAIKRDSDVEKSTTLEEEGVIDRIDSLCFAAPIYFHLTRYFFAL